MSKLEVEKFIGRYVDIVCGPGNIESECFGGILTDIDENGYACVDWGYGVKLEHIINVKPADVHLEEYTLD
jgi:hypothetical protein